MESILNKRIDAIIFDLDGTLWDATIACSMAWNKTFEQCGYNNKIDRELIKKISGSALDIVLTQYFVFINKNDYGKTIELYKQNEPVFMANIGGRLFPNEMDTLKALSKYKKMFIVSNCLEGYIENFISKKRLVNVFTGYKSSGETGFTKSKNIKLLIEENKLKAPIYVGDTQWDYEASMTNNIPFIYAKYGFGKLNNMENEIKNIKELMDLINK